MMCKEDKHSVVVSKFSSVMIDKNGAHYDLGFIPDSLRASKDEITYELEELLVKVYEAGKRSREHEMMAVLGIDRG